MDIEKIHQYNREVKKKIEIVKQKITGQKKCEKICEVCKEAGNEAIGINKKKNHHRDDKLKELSKEMKKIRLESNKNQETITEILRPMKREIKRNIRLRLKAIEVKELDERLTEIE